MGTNQRGGLPPDLAQAQDQFQAWRCRRSCGRIPRPLWALAVRLANRYGVSRTATALRLDYYSLQEHVQAAASAPERSRPAFVELPTPVPTGKQCLLELDNGAGTTLRVHLTGYDSADLEALAQSCWNAD